MFFAKHKWLLVPLFVFHFGLVVGLLTLLGMKEAWVLFFLPEFVVGSLWLFWTQGVTLFPECLAERRRRALLEGEDPQSMYYLP